MAPKIIKLAQLMLLALIVVASANDASAQRRSQRTQRKSRTVATKPVSKAPAVKQTSNSMATIDGQISHSQWDGNKETAVTFDQFPASIEEWKEMQKILGGEPQGAVALQVMAFELYRNNRTDGEQALRLNNTSTNYNSTVERLREIMGKDQYYARPYIAWALLRGATPEKGYYVRPPYTVSMKVDPNKKYQESQLLKGTVIYLLIDSKGWDTNWRGVEVVKPQGSDYYVVSNCPAMYTQCKEASK